MIVPLSCGTMPSRLGGATGLRCARATPCNLDLSVAEDARGQSRTALISIGAAIFQAGPRRGTGASREVRRDPCRVRSAGGTKGSVLTLFFAGETQVIRKARGNRARPG